MQREEKNGGNLYQCKNKSNETKIWGLLMSSICTSQYIGRKSTGHNPCHAVTEHSEQEQKHFDFVEES